MPDEFTGPPPLHVRAEFLRFLILGGDEYAPIHEAGIELHQTQVTSQLFPSDRLLDLRGGTCVGRIALLDCYLPGTLSIQDSSLGVLALDGSSLNGISGDRAKISGTLFLKKSFVSGGVVSLIGAEIGGSLHCSGAVFRREGQRSTDLTTPMLDFSSAKIAGAVSLNQNFVRHGKSYVLKNFFSDGGISLIGAQIGGSLDCTSASMLGPLNCARASIGADLICKSGNFARGIQAQSAVVAGNVNFISLTAKRAVTLAGAKIGGSFWCSASSLAREYADPSNSGDPMLDISRASIIGDVQLMTVNGKPFGAGGAVSFVSTKIGGNLNFSGAAIWAARTRTDDCLAINAQNVNVGGSVIFGGGFLARGQVSFYGAEVSRDLDFSGGSFRNKSGTAIMANAANVLGAINFQTINPRPGNPRFQSFGIVSLAGAKCGELICGGGRFNNPRAVADPSALALDCNAMNINGSAYLSGAGRQRFKAFGTVSFSTARIGQHFFCQGATFNNSGQSKNPGGVKNPEALALDCGVINVAGYVWLSNNDTTPFASFGVVSFHSASIGQHLVCAGGRFYNPRGVALTCEASKISGEAFLGAGNVNYANEDPVLQRKNRRKLVFRADGKVSFLGASVGQNLICVLGHFRNGEPDSLDSDAAGAALDLRAASVGTLFLGREEPADVPPVIKGSVNLSAATVRLLVDVGLVWEQGKGLLPTVLANDARGNSKALRCNLILDQFTYQRLQGDTACKSDLRAAWLERQPPKDLRAEFKPQPFEQLINVMRAMGYDDDADDIALSKQIYEWRAAWVRRASPVWDGLVPLREHKLTKALLQYGAAIRDSGAVLIGGAESAVTGAKAMAVIIAAWLIIIGHAWGLGLVCLLLAVWKPAAFIWKIPTSAMEFVFVNKFIGYGFQMGRAVVLLLLLVGVFGSFYNRAFQQGAIVPADKDVRNAPVAKDFVEPAPRCRVWSVAKCPEIADEAIPLFNPWLYSADVMVPVVTFGQKAAWAPTPDVAIKLPVIGQLEAPSNFVYDVQLVETVLGWVEGFLLVSFVTGLIAKE